MFMNPIGYWKIASVSSSSQEIPSRLFQDKGLDREILRLKLISNA